MGLDMYLKGEKFAQFNKPRQEDGFNISSIILELGYWRKHPNLHGFIVEQFANGVDTCQRINLTADNVRQIIKAIKKRSLPHTEGFFFGTSDPSDDQSSIEILEKALKWLETEDDRFDREIYYQASW